MPSGDRTRYKKMVLQQAQWKAQGIAECAKNGNLEGVKYLVLEGGADVHAHNERALQNASINGHSDVVRYLVEKGADVHAQNDFALRYASYSGHLEMVQLLVEVGANVNTGAMHGAVERGHLEVVRYLVEEGGAKVQAIHDYLLRYTSRKSHDELVQYLLEKGREGDACNCNAQA